jgi:hypothetical protein
MVFLENSKSCRLTKIPVHRFHRRRMHIIRFFGVQVEHSFTRFLPIYLHLHILLYFTYIFIKYSQLTLLRSLLRSNQLIQLNGNYWVSLTVERFSSPAL